MTTIVRYQDIVTCDDSYVDIIGSEVVNHRGSPKLYKHPMFNAICALSGSVSSGVFALVMRHMTNALANLKDYPNVDISATALQKEFDAGDLGNEKIPSFELGIFTKQHSIYLHYAKDAKRFTFQIHNANKLIILGTGSALATKTQYMVERYPNFDATTAAKIAMRIDSFTSNKLYVLTLNDLGEL